MKLPLSKRSTIVAFSEHKRNLICHQAAVLIAHDLSGAYEAKQFNFETYSLISILYYSLLPMEYSLMLAESSIT